MKPYGCHNSERKPGYYSPQRIYHSDGSFVVVTNWVEDRSSTDCRYDNRKNDKRCEGCKK